MEEHEKNLNDLLSQIGTSYSRKTVVQRQQMGKIAHPSNESDDLVEFGVATFPAQGPYIKALASGRIYVMSWASLLALVDQSEILGIIMPRAGNAGTNLRLVKPGEGKEN